MHVSLSLYLSLSFPVSLCLNEAFLQPLHIYVFSVCQLIAVVCECMCVCVCVCVSVSVLRQP